MTTTFPLIERLPPYVFNTINQLKSDARAAGEDIIDFGMGNPDQPPPKHIVDKLLEVAARGDTHGYSASRGIPRLRQAICNWYQRKFNVTLDPETQAIVTIGSKEGLAHLAMALVGPGESVLVPDPCYPIHLYGFVIAGGNITRVPLVEGEDFVEAVEQRIRDAWPKPKVLVLNFPANPTTQCVDLEFFERIVALCRENNIYIVQDIAYGEITFDGYEPPSILQVPGAIDIAVETYSLSKTYNMPGWRIGFVCGNKTLVSALTRVKSYLDYGIFTPMQVAAVTALDGPQDCIQDIRDLYQQRRDVLCHGLQELGWPVTPPKATMFVWAGLPEAYRDMGSLAFSKELITRAKVAVSPGVGFGDNGEGFVRFGLIENKHRIRQALRGIKHMMHEDGHI